MTRLWLDKHIDALYFWVFALLAVSLPLFPYITSISQFLLGILWLIEGNYIKKIKTFLKNKLALILISVFLLHIIWLINTSNWTYALHDIKIKLPIFVILFIGASRPAFISTKELELLIKLFIFSVFIGTLISLSNFFNWFGFKYTDVRYISRIISHIRFSLYIVMSIFFLMYLLTSKYSDLKNFEKLTFVFAVIWFIFFLVLIKSLTGLVILTIISIFYIIFFIVKVKSQRTVKYIALLVLLVVISLPFYLVITSVHLYFPDTKANLADIEIKTANGNLYSHQIKNSEFENGNYVWLFVCYKELEQEWNKRSSFSFSGVDKKGQPMRYTLIRYMTSRDLHKDSIGISCLSKTDIKNIEDGYSNYILAKKISLRARVYLTIWEIDSYIKTGNANYCSVAQRWEYLKAAKAIICNNFWFGVGTGDLQEEYNSYYKESKSKLMEPRWKRAHNQYATFFVTFGVFGFTMVLFAFISPFLLAKEKLSSYFITFYLIFLLSMLNEDTLETQAGVTSFSLFLTVFLFTIKTKYKSFTEIRDL